MGVRRCCSLGTLWLMAAAAGCGSQRVEIDGTVTVDGRPLDRGYISLRPMAGTGGPTAGSEVTDGKFRIAAKEGTHAGKFRVEITASRKTGRQVPDDLGGGMADVYEQYLPARYNAQSELTAEIRANERNELRFVLETE